MGQRPGQLGSALAGPGQEDIGEKAVLSLTFCEACAQNHFPTAACTGILAHALLETPPSQDFVVQVTHRLGARAWAARTAGSAHAAAGPFGSRSEDSLPVSAFSFGEAPSGLAALFERQPGGLLVHKRVDADFWVSCNY